MRQQQNNQTYEGHYNVGPENSDCVSTKELVELFEKHWDGRFEWTVQQDAKAAHEANFLKLDCSKIKSVFNWRPKWGIDCAVKKTAEWTKHYMSGTDIGSIMNAQIEEYLAQG